MSLIQPLKFRTWETGHFKTPRLQTSRLQTGVFQTVVAVAFELYPYNKESSKLVGRKEGMY